MTNRKFGVEIELTGLSINQALNAIMATGVAVSTDTSYRHNGYSQWKVIHDSSVSNGCEVISRILQGNEGIEELKKVAKALSDAGASANRTCGLHVHVDASDLEGKHLRHIVTRYAQFENTIDSFMPKSRRGNTNNFCYSVASTIANFNPNSNYNDSWYTQRWFSPTPTDVCNALNNRYLKVNLQSYLRQRTIEFRQHSGSVNANKIANWVQFVLQFTDYSVRTSPNNSQNFARVSRANLYQTLTRVSYLHTINYSHKQILARLCSNVNNYVSSSELARSGGILPARLSSHISVLRHDYGVRIINKRGLGYKLYRPDLEDSVQNPNAPSETYNPQNDGLWNGIDSNLVSFYEQRAATLR